MSAYKNIFSACLVVCGLMLSQCSSSTSSTTDTDTDTDSDTSTDTDTDAQVDTENLSSRMASSASALLPEITTDADAALIPFLTYNAETDWDVYSAAENIAYLEEIFGNTENGPVTQVRVLIDQLADDIEQIIAADPETDCDLDTEEFTATAIADADTLDIAFYGEIDNGAADNRFFHCAITIAEGDTTDSMIYGIDDDGVFHIVIMSDSTHENTDQAELRGDEQRILQVNLAHYAEVTEDAGDFAYLDLQYTQASLYNGADHTFATDDDVEFKSRSRITGQIAINEDGSIGNATGEFTVTKHEIGQNGGIGDSFTIDTRTIGRGSYGDGDFSLFKIDSTADPFEGHPGTFCLEASADAATSVPAATDSTNCADLESGFAWGDATFPFDLAPALDAAFEDKDFFNGDETDLIASDGSNFTIPSFE